jgi:glucosamine--fructose-6-phosphate aminotransferase (isomerizing)
MLAIVLADAKGLLSSATKHALIADLAKIPGLVGECLLREEDVEEVSKKIMNAENALYLGRGIQMPIAYEGALKLKEISYIHAEGYPAGEMKHGPIALLDDDLPVVAICPQDRWHDKMISQIEQAKARGAYVIAVAEDGDEKVASLADDVLWVPHTSWLLMPVLTVIPLQILAYQIAALRGLDVDQPRNLAKSVTVE